MVSLGFNSSSEFLDLNDSDLSDLILKLKMNFKHDKQFRKMLNNAKIACGMIEDSTKINKFKKLEKHDSFSSLSSDNNNNNFNFNTMEPGISKMALIDLTKKMKEFTKISEKCNITLNKLINTYEAAQIEMDRVYNNYKKQIDNANIKAKEILHSFVTNKQNKIILLQKTMKIAVNNMKKCEEECYQQYKLGNQDKISKIIQNTMKNIKLPSDFSVSSWKFDVEYVEKLDIFPPVLQPDNTPYYNPIININTNYNLLQGQDDIIIDNLNLKSPKTNNKSNKPIIRRSSIVLGDINPNEIEKQQQQQSEQHINPYINPLTQQLQSFMINPPITQITSQQIAAQQALLQQQQFQQQLQQQQQYAIINNNNNNNNNLIINNHINKYEWLETKDLWRGGHVQINNNNSVTINGGVCLLANIEITKRDGIFYWEIYIEKISNRCWIGILPGPISSINWKIGECPPLNNKAIGIENTYGFIYKSTTKCGNIGRAPKNRDHIRFKLDIKNNVLYGSLNDKEVNKVFYKGDDIPQIACIAIINSTGKGKFHIRS